MNIPGLLTIQPEQTGLLEHLARMMGESFLEEPWQQHLFAALDGLGTPAARKLEISQTFMRCDLEAAAPFGAVLATEDLAGGMLAYRASELGGRAWLDIEEEAYEQLSHDELTADEERVLLRQEKRLAAASDFSWIIEEANGRDFIHLFSIGVDTAKRGTGAFRRLTGPVLAYADDQGLPCYLEAYSERLEGLYGHISFDVVRTLEEPTTGMIERCMVREPQ